MYKVEHYVQETARGFLGISKKVVLRLSSDVIGPNQILELKSKKGDVFAIIHSDQWGGLCLEQFSDQAAFDYGGFVDYKSAEEINASKKFAVDCDFKVRSKNGYNGSVEVFNVTWDIANQIK
jgi:hypothetical protein